MKYKLFVYSFVPVLGFVLPGATSASAQGILGMMGMGNATPEQISSYHQTMFQDEASLLGISVDDVKNGWAQGKSLMQIAQDHNITKEQLQQKMKDAQIQKLKSQMQILVEKGVLTQAQADQRLQFMQTNAGKRIGRGHHMGFHF